MGEFIIMSILEGFDQKSLFFEGCSWFEFNNLRLALDMAFKFYASVKKELNIKVRKFRGLILTFLEVKGGQPAFMLPAS